MSSGYTKAKLERRAAGLCMRCGVVRAAVAGSTTTVCGECKRARNAVQYARLAQKREVALAYKREWNRLARRKRIDAGQCADCGMALKGRALTAGFRHCAVCRARDLATVKRHQERKRAAKGGTIRSGSDGKPLDMPKSGSLGAVRRLSVRLDVLAVKAVMTLKERDYAARVAAARSKGLPLPPAAFHTSRIVRAAIGEFAELARAATVRNRGGNGKAGDSMADCAFGFRADVATVQIVERHAAVRGGNLSWAVCDLLVAAAFGGFAVRVGFGGEREARRERLARFDPHGEGG